MSPLRRVTGTIRMLAQVRRERRAAFLPDAEPRRIRDRRVRKIVDHAYRTVPHYRETMRRLGLAPADFARIEREVGEGFQAIVGHRVRVDVERVAVIPSQPGGKVAAISALPRS